MPKPIILESEIKFRESLEASINQYFENYQASRIPKPGDSFGKRWKYYWDRRIYRDEMEYLETADIPMAKRIELVEALGRLNRRSGYEMIFLRDLEGMIFSFPTSAFLKTIRILDVGAGAGGLLKAIYHWAKEREIQIELYGIDCSADFIKAAQCRLNEQGFPINLSQADACDLRQFEDESFDVVISSYMVHHIRTPGKVALFFSEIHRVAKKGWIIADFDRRVYAPEFSRWAGFLFGSSRILNSDGVKSARRAYRAEEINFILSEIQKKQKLSGMKCKAYPVLPYWKVKGRKWQKMGALPFFA